MKAMILFDLVIMRRILLQLLGICAVTSVAVSYGTGSIVGVSATISAMVPVFYLMTVLAYDEAHGWESFRLTLPLNRAAVVLGRYAGLVAVAAASVAVGVLVGAGMAWLSGMLSSAVPSLRSFGFGANPFEAIVAGGIGGGSMSLVMAAFSLPFAMRLGMTRGVRLVPLLVVAVVVGGGFLFSEDGPLSWMVSDSLRWLLGDSDALVFLCAAIIGVALAIYAISVAVSLRLYRTREL